MSGRVCFLFAVVLAGVAQGEGRRHALIVGANQGWAMDESLRYAIDDARRVAEVLTTLGDFAPTDVTVLEEPTAEQLDAALLASEAQRPSLFVFFYSGHADARALHLTGATTVELDGLYRRLKAHPAAVKIGLIDACRAGSLLAAKGARPTSAFQVTDDATVEGTALLASSGADELSHEARSIRGSFFTHHLVSGLRGAADGNRDGRVTLDEVYQYAASRTVADTVGSTGGPQRPVFRFELKGRGNVTLTEHRGATLRLVFGADQGTCFVMDETERRLWADVAGAATVSVPPGPYVVKCPTASAVQVAALSGSPGQEIAVPSLVFRERPLAEAGLKGASRDAPEADLHRAGVLALRNGDPDAALEAFNAALAKDLRDQEAYRGKAQALLAQAERASSRGDPKTADALRQAAVRTDPRLANDPQLRAMFPAAPPPAVRRESDLNRANLEGAFPRQYQRFGLGVGLVNPHGVLALSVDWVVREWLQLALHVCPFVLGAGLSGRVLFRSGNWSPYAGLGANLTAAGLALTQGPDFVVRAGMTELIRRETFDRLIYAEGGVQVANRHWQGEAGLALAVTAPPGNAAAVAVFPALSVRYFP